MKGWGQFGDGSGEQLLAVSISSNISRLEPGHTKSLLADDGVKITAIDRLCVLQPAPSQGGASAACVKCRPGFCAEKVPP